MKSQLMSYGIVQIENPILSRISLIINCEFAPNIFGNKKKHDIKLSAFIIIIITKALFKARQCLTENCNTM